uniref:Uncharacterized protein n=1 Tax=viral metagenome TaxID=1070528 RepID=A0A6C0BNT2_9ZZZZ
MDPEALLFGTECKQEIEILKALADLAPKEEDHADGGLDRLDKLMEDFGDLDGALGELSGLSESSISSLGDDDEFDKKWQAKDFSVDVPVPIPPVEISNVVCQSSVCCDLDIAHCERTLKNVTRHKRFPALFVRLKSPAVTLLIFSNGKVLATGGKSYDDDHQAVRQLCKILRKLGYTQAKVGPVRIVNLVAQMTMDFPIQISKMIEDPLHRRYCQSQGGKFSCINYKIKTLVPPVTVKIFGNGSVGFQSAKTVDTLHEAVKLMVPVFYQFRLPRYEPVDPQSLVSHVSHLPQIN